eukprot:TRINITY_DN5099_c0_g5_i1.p1 TRINITY_DN5099_c0_g5~~TRINITY_DN5099_c0_g5_i1.p1  ORF type:complete len:430 (+),score=109.23 TRINITY_DN5099_c0_g5_i1:358-1647(+)
MEGYFKLAEHFITQQNPTFCGLAALAMSLNALHIDPKRLWKAPWRWFSEDMLDCCIPIETVKKRGLTYTEFSCLAKCSGADISSLRPSETSEEYFRETVKRVSSQQDKDQVLVVTYSRKALNQTGDGHFSPIGGYHPTLDLALVMDVARFKYTPHWVSVHALWEAMKLTDSFTGQSRGFFILEKANPCSSVCKINANVWSKLSSQFHIFIPDMLRSTKPQSVEEVFENILKHLPKETAHVFSTYPNQQTQGKEIQHLCDQLKNTKMYQIIQDIMQKSHFVFGSQSPSNNSTTTNDHTNPIHQINGHHLSSSSSPSPPSSPSASPPSSHASSPPEASLNFSGLFSSNLRHSPSNEKMTVEMFVVIILLACPSQIYNTLDVQLREKISNIRSLDLLPDSLRKEIMNIREQMFVVSNGGRYCRTRSTCTIAN